MRNYYNDELLTAKRGHQSIKVIDKNVTMDYKYVEFYYFLPFLNVTITIRVLQKKVTDSALNNRTKRPVQTYIPTELSSVVYKLSSCK